MTLHTSRPFVPTQRTMMRDTMLPDSFTTAYMDDMSEFMDDPNDHMELDATDHVGRNYKISAYSDD